MLRSRPLLALEAMVKRFVPSISMCFTVGTSFFTPERSDWGHPLKGTCQEKKVSLCYLNLAQDFTIILQNSGTAFKSPPVVTENRFGQTLKASLRSHDVGMDIEHGGKTAGGGGTNGQRREPVVE